MYVFKAISLNQSINDPKYSSLKVPANQSSLKSEYKSVQKLKSAKMYWTTGNIIFRTKYSIKL